MTQAAILAASGSPGTTTGFKNRLINGNIAIAQRGTSSSDPASNQYVIDRWVTGLNVTGKISIAQSSVAPAGFTNSLLITSSSAYTVQPSDIIYLQQRIEGFNTADLAFGTASANSLAMSFWVRSSLTGTFSAFIQNSDETRIYAFTYTIAAANTWQKVTTTIPGDTSGTWIGATNGIGMRVSFSICAGSSYLTSANSWNSATAFGVTGQTNLVATNGATFYVTGIQLESGTTATNFDFRSITQEISLCQRYYFQQGGGNYTRFGGAIALARSPTQATSVPFFPVAMRTFPTVSSVNLSSTSINSTAVSTISLSSDESTPNFPVGPARLNVFVSGGLTSGVGYEWESNNNTTTRITFSAEL